MTLLATLRQARRTLTAGTALLALFTTLALAGPAEAQSARHIKNFVDITSLDAEYTRLCGTPVYMSVQGSLNVIFVYNQEGLLVKRIFTPGGLKVTYSAPETGNSFSYSWNTGHFDFGDGAQVGSTVTARFAGLFGHVPGYLAGDAGQIVLTGVVIGFDAFGTPIVDFDESVVVERGHREGAAIDAAVCAALTA